MKSKAPSEAEQPGGDADDGQRHREPDDQRLAHLAEQQDAGQDHQQEAARQGTDQARLGLCWSPRTRRPRTGSSPAAAPWPRSAAAAARTGAWPARRWDCGGDDGLDAVAPAHHRVLPHGLEAAHHLGHRHRLGSAPGSRPGCPADCRRPPAPRPAPARRMGSRRMPSRYRPTWCPSKAYAHGLRQVLAGDAELAAHLFVEHGLHQLHRLAPVVAHLLGLRVGAHDGLGLLGELTQHLRVRAVKAGLDLGVAPGTDAQGLEDGIRSRASRSRMHGIDRVPHLRDLLPGLGLHDDLGVDRSPDPWGRTPG